MSNRLPDLAFAAAAAALGIGIVFVFRSMYLAEDILPFAQEMTLIFLGAVVTIILTAALLNRQTDLELRKEGSSSSSSNATFTWPVSKRSQRSWKPQGTMRS
ncbi:hypothetical protein [Brevundimonas sp. EYE_349]|uniref:hypothetical protein n=1 Tax=Brevundimonas sp. EYE_349 TaxID=2853455 RepID=UPI002004E267|nr:hypothetical protein [Brevundimonas sp. EYE_349]MCK6102917.1 hypothetical protein [Brevundimonas sp. EYE_349]